MRAGKRRKKTLAVLVTCCVALVLAVAGSTQASATTHPAANTWHGMARFDAKVAGCTPARSAKASPKSHLYSWSCIAPLSASEKQAKLRAYRATHPGAVDVGAATTTATTMDTTTTSTIDYEMYCPTGGCYFRNSNTNVQFSSNTVYYGIYGPDGSTAYEVGKMHYVFNYDLIDPRNHGMYLNGYSNFTTIGYIGNDVVGYSAAMQNGAAGYKLGGGSQIGGPVCSGQFNDPPDNDNLWASNSISNAHFPCVEADWTSYDHNGTMEVEWVSSDHTRVPDGIYWYCYAHSIVAHSSTVGSEGYWTFHDLWDPYHGLVDQPIHCQAGPDASYGFA